MRSTNLMLILLAAQASFGQLEQVPHGPDLDHLYNRVSESVYVIKGRVLGSRGVGRRAPRTVTIVNGRGSISGTGLEGASLFTVSVEEMVCRQGDFSAAPSDAPLAPASIIHFFVPFNEPRGVPSKFNPYLRTNAEDLMDGEEYLLFIRKEPRKEEELLSTYQLEPGLSYYRTYEGNRGAIRLPDAAHPEGPYSFREALASAVASFCGAVKSPDVENKIRNLNAIREANGPVWRQSVDGAIDALRGAPPRPPQKQD